MTAQEVLHAEAILTRGVVDFEEADSHRAANVFNLTDRKRSTTLDYMIAASAMLQRARVATTNVAEFQPFAAHGLRIEAVPM
jgi:predicted nucleic acid-binding protein